ncbi:MAG: hypothetical protein KGS45_01095 [Planctomycetes bacterium]|nr:hypothetical protein [Planctomycetota bacterium]
MRAFACVAVAGLLLSSSAVAQVPQAWKIQLQCRGTNASNIPTFNLPAGASLTNQTPSINDAGQAAVRAAFSSGQIVDVVFIGRDGTGSVVVRTQGGTGFSSAEMDLTDSTLLLTRAGGSAVEQRLLNGTLEQSFGAPNGESVVSYTRSRWLGNSVGYRGTTAGGVRKWIIDRFGPTGREQRNYLADGAGTSFLFLYPPTANAALQMGGKVDDSAGNSAIIRMNAPGAITTLFSSTEPEVDFIAGGTDMNASGQMAFFVRYNTSIGTVFRLIRGDGQARTQIAQAGDLGITSPTMGNFPPAISSSGLVAFRARDAAGDALYIGDGTTLKRIVGMNDIVNTDLGPLALGFNFGGANIQAISGPIDINTRNQIVFCGVLSNGSIGMFTVSPCAADFNGDGILDFFDYLDFVAAFSANDPSADFNGDGVIDFFDYLDFVAAFAEGC